MTQLKIIWGGRVFNQLPSVGRTVRIDGVVPHNPGPPGLPGGVMKPGRSWSVPTSYRGDAQSMVKILLRMIGNPLHNAKKKQIPKVIDCTLFTVPHNHPRLSQPYQTSPTSYNLVG